MANQEEYNSKFVFTRAISVALGSITCGFGLVILNPYTDLLATHMNWKGSERAFYISLSSTFLPLGGILGSLTVRYFIAMGRIIALRVGMISNILGTLIISITFFFVYPQNYGVIFAIPCGRFLTGIGIGFLFTCCPMTIRETSPDKVRGSYMTFFQVGTYSGSFIAFLIPFTFPSHIPGTIGYVGLFIGIVPLVCFIAQLIMQALCVKYDTPKYYASIGNLEMARVALREIYITESRANEELQKILDVFENEKKDVNDSSGRALCLAYGAVIFLQLTGVNIVTNYSVEILVKQGQFLAKFGTLLIGISSLASSFITIWTIDRFGRKTLYIYGSIFIVIFLVLIGLTYNVENQFIVLFLFLYIISYTLSHGTVCWTYISEILKPKDIGYANAMSGFFIFVVTFSGPNLLNWIHGYLFLCLAFTTIGFIFFCSIFMIETAGKSEYEIGVALGRYQQDPQLSKMEITNAEKKLS